MNKQENITLANAQVKLDKLPVAGRKLIVLVQKGQLAQIARCSKVKTVEILRAELLVTPVKGGARVSGRLQARVSQPCVVTLAPVTQTIEEELARIFVFGPDINEGAAPGSENFIDLSADEIPDYIEGNELDLSALVLEALGLAIELYPRAPGAELTKEHSGNDPEKLSAFALLRSADPSDAQ